MELSRTVPPFTLTRHVFIDVIRTGEGGYVNYKWVDGQEELIEGIKANVQPARFKDLQLLPESERTKEYIKVFTVDELRTAKEGNNNYGADIILWKGNRYRVMSVKNYEMGVLDHYKSLAAREPISAGY